MAGNIRMLSNNTNSRHSTGSTAPTAPGSTTFGSASAAKKPRRLWTLHDRSAVSVNLLKANLAQDGCEEAQLNVAKKLLNDTSDDSITVQNENARLAIYWLVKSSEQGNEEATELLKNCLESGKGINCQNIIDVQICIDTPRNDKLTVKAARLLYEKLNNGEDFITTTQLEARLLQVRESRTVSFSSHEAPPPEAEQNSSTQAASGTPHSKPTINQLNQDFDETNNLLLHQPHAFESLDKKQKLQKDAASSTTTGRLSFSGPPQDSVNKNLYRSPSSRNGVKLTEEDMTKNASMYNLGEIPPILLRNSNTLFSGQFHHWHFKSYATVSFLQFVMLFLLWSNTSLSLRNILPILGLMAGTWSSYNLFGWYWNERRFTDWTILYQTVLREENWSEIPPTTIFYGNYRKPYLLAGLFSALIFTLCNLTAQEQTASHHWLQFPVGSLTILVLLLLFDFKQRPSWEFLGLLLIQVFPVTTKLIQNYMPWSLLPSLQEYFDYVNSVASEFMSDYFPEIRTFLEKQEHIINSETLASITKWAQVFLFSKLVLNAIGRSKLKHGKFLSELLLILWIYQFVQWSQFLVVGHNVLLVGACYLNLGATLLILASLPNVNVWRFCIALFTCVVITSTVLISLCMVFPISQDINGGLSATGPNNLLRLPFYDESSNEDEELGSPPLTWDEYDANCHQSAWKLQNLGYTQLSCPLKYNNRKIRWKGKVAIVHVRNPDETSTSEYRRLTSNLVFEILLSMDSEGVAGSNGESWKNYIPFRIGQASDNFQSTIALLIPVTTPQDFQLKLIQQLLSLRSGDEIEFIGRLGNHVGGVVPEITNVEKLWCLRCDTAEQGELALSDISGEELLTFADLKDSYNYLEAVLVNGSQIAWNYTQSLLDQIQGQFSFNESVSAIADE